MKKVSLAVALIAVFTLFISANALADEEICGTINNVLYIEVYESDAADVPVMPCYLFINFTSENQQFLECVPASAFGTLINVALLKAYNEQIPVSACLKLVWDKNLRKFMISITKVDFGVPCPPATGPSWANGAIGSPVVRNSASPLRG